jgi:predicted transcriptional regulator
MKIKPLKIVFEPVGDFAARTKAQLKKAVASGRAGSSPKNTLRFASVAVYQQVMSDQKYAILAAIYCHEPKSVYQLAKIVGRPAQNVVRDCKVLESHGFLVQEETGDSRRTKTPRLAFDYNAIVIYMPSITYKVEFEDDAA